MHNGDMPKNRPNERPNLSTGRLKLDVCWRRETREGKKRAADLGCLTWLVQRPAADSRGAPSCLTVVSTPQRTRAPSTVLHCYEEKTTLHLVRDVPIPPLQFIHVIAVVDHFRRFCDSSNHQFLRCQVADHG